MQELVYLSHATQRFSERDLLTLLEMSRKNNLQKDITGVLLYDGESMFIQAIEGEENALNQLFDKIQQDKRHNRIVTLWRGEIEQRSFTKWRMGFERFNAPQATNTDGFFSLSGSYIDDIENQKSFAVDLLHHFRQQLM